MSRIEWVMTTCSRCGGYGMVSHWSANDFEGAKECPECITGSVWVRRTGHVMAYRGGPMVGMWPTEFPRALERVLQHINAEWIRRWATPSPFIAMPDEDAA